MSLLLLKLVFVCSRKNAERLLLLPPGLAGQQLLLQLGSSICLCCRRLAFHSRTLRNRTLQCLRLEVNKAVIADFFMIGVLKGLTLSFLEKGNSLEEGSVIRPSFVLWRKNVFYIFLTCGQRIFELPGTSRPVPLFLLSGPGIQSSRQFVPSHQRAIQSHLQAAVRYVLLNLPPSYFSFYFLIQFLTYFSCLLVTRRFVYPWQRLQIEARILLLTLFPELKSALGF